MDQNAEIGLFICNASPQKLAEIARAMEDRLLELSFSANFCDASYELAGLLAEAIEQATIDPIHHPVFCGCDNCAATRSDTHHDRVVDGQILGGKK